MNTINYKDENGNITELKAVVITHNLLIEGKIPAMVTSENKFFMQLAPEMPMIDINNFLLIKGQIPFDLMIKYGRYYYAHERGELQKLWESKPQLTEPSV